MQKPVTLKENNMDTPEHVSLYMEGLKMRRKVVGEDYVENALEKGKSDFLRPLQQFATVCSLCFDSRFQSQILLFLSRSFNLNFTRDLSYLKSLSC